MSAYIIPDYDSPILDGWREAAGENWSKYIEHEFVLGLGNGNLPREAFIAYLIQDYIFLLNFSRAWAMGIVKAETATQMRTAARRCQELGIPAFISKPVRQSDLIDAIMVGFRVVIPAE